MDKATEHEERSRNVADTLRRFLIAIHTGGIGALLFVASSLVEQHVHPRWTFIPVLVFVCGLVVVGVSMLLAKTREKERRDAEQKNEPKPTFTWLWHSQPWDTFSLILFVVGAVAGLIALSCIKLNLTP
jgi:hypothetical protein